MSDTRVKAGHVLGLEMYPKVVSPEQVDLEDGELGAVLTVTVRRADGSIREQWSKKSESFTRQFIDLLIVQMGGVDTRSGIEVRDITNTLVAIGMSPQTLDSNALVNDDTFSIVLGTGNTAPTITDYAIETKIAHGAGAGQLQHSLTAFGLPTSNATQSHFTITRDFSNASGGDITVNEIGLYQRGREVGVVMHDSSRAMHIFLTIRDTIAGGIVIGNGETLTINYRLVSQL